MPTPEPPGWKRGEIALVVMGLLAVVAFGLIATRHNRKSDRVEALRLLSEAQKVLVDSDRPPGGLSADDARRLSDAKNSIRRAIEIDPNNGETHDAMGIYLRQVGNLEQAASEFQTAMRLDPKAFAPHVNYSILLQNELRFQEALEEADEAMKLCACLDAVKVKAAALMAQYGHPRSLSRAGYVPMPRDQQLATARFLLEAVVVKEPSNFKAFSHLGTVLDWQGFPNEAIAEYQRALDINPNYVQAEHDRGLSLLTLQRYDEAETSFRRAIAKVPTFPNAFAGLADLRSRQGRFTEASAAIQEAKRLQPSDDAIRTLDRDMAEHHPSEYAAAAAEMKRVGTARSMALR